MHTISMLLKILSLILIPSVVLAAQTCEPIKIAIIDTGLDLKDPRFTEHLCKDGHKNFVNDEPMDDLKGHGTFVAGLVEKYAENANYCILIYKYYSDYTTGYDNVKREVASIHEAVANGATIINFSGGGEEFSEDESLAIKENPDVTFVVAAGNDGLNLDLPGNKYYPASLFYDNIEVVENIDASGNIARSSNYSKRIRNKEIGEKVESYLPNNKIGILSGTSMSTAIFSGKLLAKKLNSCNYSR